MRRCITQSKEMSASIVQKPPRRVLLITAVILSVLITESWFLFQAEDGIRDIGVTGVQTCALPISFLRVAMLMPYATAVAAATLVFALIFGRDAGLVNGLLGAVGIDPVDWRNGDWTAQIAISVIVIWRWTGYNALIYLAGMQSISQDLYEAAALDGANRWQQFLHVTLPGLRPTILFTVVVSTIGASQLFGEPLLFGGGQANGGPANQYQTLGLFMYQQGWQIGALGP